MPHIIIMFLHDKSINFRIVPGSNSNAATDTILKLLYQHRDRSIVNSEGKCGHKPTLSSMYNHFSFLVH